VHAVLVAVGLVLAPEAPPAENALVLLLGFMGSVAWRLVEDSRYVGILGSLEDR
jgi:hypothetical protein